MLISAVTIANALAVISATLFTSVFMMKLKSRAISVVPVVCPTRRPMLSIPLAPPERALGAEDIIMLLLEVWNMAKPIPVTAMHHMTLRCEVCGVRKERRKRPMAKMNMPSPPMMAGLTLSIKKPATGLIIIEAAGHAVMRSPVVTSVWRLVF